MEVKHLHSLSVPHSEADTAAVTVQGGLRLQTEHYIRGRRFDLHDAQCSSTAVYVGAAPLNNVLYLSSPFTGFWGKLSNSHFKLLTELDSNIFSLIGCFCRCWINRPQGI